MCIRDSHDFLRVLHAHIAVVPRLEAGACDGGFILRVAQNKAVFRRVLLDVYKRQLRHSPRRASARTRLCTEMRRGLFCTGHGALHTQAAPHDIQPQPSGAGLDAAPRAEAPPICWKTGAALPKAFRPAAPPAGQGRIPACAQDAFFTARPLSCDTEKAGPLRGPASHGSYCLIDVYKRQPQGTVQNSAWRCKNAPICASSSSGAKVQVEYTRRPPGRRARCV